MSTPAQILVRNHRGIILFNFYHQYDGSIDGVGQDVADALIDTRNQANDDNMTGNEYADQFHLNLIDRGDYEPVAGDDVFMDTEFVYDVQYGSDGTVCVAVETDEGKIRGDLDTFVNMVFELD